MIDNDALEPRPIQFQMPPPISANDLKSGGYNDRKVTDTKKYTAWKKTASVELSKLRGCRVTWPATIIYQVGQRSTKMNDVGNCEKAYTDALVTAGILRGDSRRYVRGVASEWVKDCDTCRVVIAPAFSFLGQVPS